MEHSSRVIRGKLPTFSGRTLCELQTVVLASRLARKDLKPLPPVPDVVISAGEETEGADVVSIVVLSVRRIAKDSQRNKAVRGSLKSEFST